MGLVLLLGMSELLCWSCGVFSERVGSCLCLWGLVGNYHPHFWPIETGFVVLYWVVCPWNVNFLQECRNFWKSCVPGKSWHVSLLNVETFGGHVSLE